MNNLILFLNKDFNYDEFTSFSFKILIKQLKTLLHYSKEKDKEDVINKKFHDYVKNYGSLPTVKNDLQKIFKGMEYD